MYVAVLPNRSSPIAVLLRESYRDGDSVKTGTLANLTHWSADKLEALRRVLKDATKASCCRSIFHRHCVSAVISRPLVQHFSEKDVDSLDSTKLEPSVRTRLVGVQGGRGIAALLVVAYHSTIIMALPKFVGYPPLWDFFAFGHSGVDFFFVLSGFIIAHAHCADLSRPERAFRYGVRRITRIYPIYWLVTGALCLYMAVSHTAEASLSLGNLLSSFLLLPDGKETILGVAWTLRSEMLFYTAFCLVIIDGRLGKPLIFGALILILGGIYAAPRGSWATTFTSPYNLEFLLGIWGARLLDRETIQKPVHILILGILVFASFGSVEVYALHSYPAVLGRIVYGAASLLILLGIVAGERQGAINIGRPLLLLGDASYCLYLIHFPLIGSILRVYNRFGILDSVSPNVVASSLIILPTLGALGLRKWVEAPLLGFVNTTRSARLPVRPAPE